MEERTKTEQNGVITDELREYVGDLQNPKANRLRAIADRIDGQAEELGRMWDEAEGADLKAFEATHVKLPVDADGVPIHVGDVIEWVDEPDVSRVVSSIQLAEDGWWVYIGGTGRRPDKHRHHHEPTVEDVLREFAYGLGVPVADSYVAATAAKLRLAGDE